MIINKKSLKRSHDKVDLILKIKAKRTESTSHDDKDAMIIVACLAHN